MAATSSGRVAVWSTGAARRSLARARAPWAGCFKTTPFFQKKNRHRRRKNLLESLDLEVLIRLSLRIPLACRAEPCTAPSQYMIFVSIACCAPVVGRQHVSLLTNSDSRLVVGRRHASLLTNSDSRPVAWGVGTRHYWPTQTLGLSRGTSARVTIDQLRLSACRVGRRHASLLTNSDSRPVVGRRHVSLLTNSDSRPVAWDVGTRHY